MRGMSSKDGKLSGNIQTVGRYEDSKQGGRGADRRPDKGGGHSGGLHGQDGDDSQKPISNVIEEHGPAEFHSVEKHGNDFHSTTRHSDGHEHKATHSSLAEAHDHGKQAMEDTESNENDHDSQDLSEQRDRSESKHPSKKGQDISFLD